MTGLYIFVGVYLLVFLVYHLYSSIITCPFIVLNILAIITAGGASSIFYLLKQPFNFITLGIFIVLYAAVFFSNKIKLKVESIKNEKETEGKMSIKTVKSALYASLFVMTFLETSILTSLIHAFIL
jgi:uncharacterized membrane protein YvlD (DUF360 family)